MFAVFKARPCLAHDLTIRHLELKLRHYNRRTQKVNATQTDYMTRDRVAAQLLEARAYLC